MVHEAVRIDRNSRHSNISSLNSKSEYGRGHLPRLIVDIEAKVDVKTSSLKDFDTMNELKMKERNEGIESEESSKVDPCKTNSILNFVELFDDFETPPTAAETKPKPKLDRSGEKLFKCRQQKEIDMTQHTSFSKVRKRRRYS